MLECHEMEHIREFCLDVANEGVKRLFVKFPSITEVLCNYHSDSENRDWQY